MNNNTLKSVREIAIELLYKIDAVDNKSGRKAHLEQVDILVTAILSERQEAENWKTLSCTEVCAENKNVFSLFSQQEKEIEKLRQENEALKNEIQNLRSYCMVTFGESHPEMRKCIHELENEALRAQVEKLNNLIQRILGDSHVSDVHSMILAEGFKYDE